VARYQRTGPEAIEVTLDKELQQEAIKKSGADFVPLPAWTPRDLSQTTSFKIKAIIRAGKTPNELDRRDETDGFAFFVRE
jgi:hypothetical protein